MTEETYFAPAGRASRDEVSQQQQAVLQEVCISALLSALPDMVMILNGQRQIVAANEKLLSAFGVSSADQLIGMRPGEAVSCLHSDEGTDGCGTSEKCSACGAVLTILASQESGKTAEGECRLMIARTGMSALDLDVTATPVEIAGQTMTLLTLRDISDEKRRQVLERTFFHDILNTVGGIQGIAGLLAEGESLSPESEIEYKSLLVGLAEGMAEEISQQRRLLAAERGDYEPELQPVDLPLLLRDVSRLYGSHVRVQERTLTLDDMEPATITTDRALLRRVVGNMLLNAMEATRPGGNVRLALTAAPEQITIRVINQGEIPHDVGLRIFKRSFSTKAAAGRGIGTYSMKLFGEQYLGGRVGFTSADGTTEFFITLPR